MQCKDSKYPGQEYKTGCVLIDFVSDIVSPERNDFKALYRIGVQLTELSITYIHHMYMQN